MKKLLFSLVTSLLMVASGCSNEQAPDMPKEQNETVIKVKVRSADEAIAIAMAAKKRYSSEKSRASLTVKDVKCYGAQTSRSGLGADSLYYIVNFNDEQGYAIIGADRRIESVLAVIDEGNFNEDNIEKDSPREYMYNLIKDYTVAQTLDDVVINPIDTLRPNYRYWVEFHDTLDYRKERMLYTRWAQDGVYANYAGTLYKTSVDRSKWRAGCGPLAMVMAMSYFKHPSAIKITYDKSNRNVTLDWESMLQYESELHAFQLIDDPAIPIAQEQIPLLLRETAQRVGSVGLENGGVITEVWAIPVQMRELGFSCVQENVQEGDIIPLPSVQNNRIIICCGYTDSSNINYDGHAFVFDGVDMIRAEHGIYIYEKTGLWDELIGKEVEREEYHFYVHVNWGWGGQDNGYYSYFLYNDTSYRELDKWCSGTSDPYTYKRFKYISVSKN